MRKELGIFLLLVALDESKGFGDAFDTPLA